MSKNSKLRLIDLQLPPMPKLDKQGNIIVSLNKVKVQGKDLLKQGHETIKIKGKDVAVQEDHNYIAEVEQPILRNKFNDMKEILREHGPDGVNEYIKLCYDYHNLPNPGVKFQS